MAITNPVASGNASQIQLASAPATNQYTFREMVGQVMQSNPDAPALMVQRWVQNAYRRIIDRRNWYGLLVLGQCVVPNVYTRGNVALTIGSQSVQGTGTSWTADMVGRQFRSGFMTPFSTITEVDVTNQVLTLNLPWGGPTNSSSGYSIFQNIVSLGSNIKRVFQMVNQRQGYALLLNVPQDILNIYDTWRTYTGWTYLLANYSPSPTGDPQFELYPIPTFQQAFPFMAYTQPPDLSADNDYPASFIRGDIIIDMAMADALMYRGKSNKYYDPNEAKRRSDRAAYQIEQLALADNNLYQGASGGFQFNYRFGAGLGPAGANFAQSHAVGGDQPFFSWEI